MLPAIYSLARIGAGPTALMRVSSHVTHAPGVVRVYGEHLYGGAIGADADDCQPPTAADRLLWERHHQGGERCRLPAAAIDEGVARALPRVENAGQLPGPSPLRAGQVAVLRGTVWWVEEGPATEARLASPTEAADLDRMLGFAARGRTMLGKAVVNILV